MELSCLLSLVNYHSRNKLFTATCFLKIQCERGVNEKECQKRLNIKTDAAYSEI